MSTSGHVPDGTDLLAQELRDEFAHLARHPIEELKRLEHVAADGDNPTTPLLTVIGVGFGVAVLFAAVLGLTLLVVSLDDLEAHAPRSVSTARIAATSSSSAATRSSSGSRASTGRGTSLTAESSISPPSSCA